MGHHVERVSERGWSKLTTPMFKIDQTQKIRKFTVVKVISGPAPYVVTKEFPWPEQTRNSEAGSCRSSG